MEERKIILIFAAKVCHDKTIVTACLAPCDRMLMKNNVFILKVVDASYVDDYTLMLTFNNGDKRKCDFAPLSKKGICTKLQDLDYFKSFSLDPFTVDWNNEIGFAPEFLYEHSTSV